MQDDDIPAAWLDADQNGSQMIQSVHVAHRNENISRACANGFGRQRAFHFQVELIHFHVLGAAALMLGVSLRNRENDKKRNRKRDAGDGGLNLRKQVEDGDAEQNKRDQSEADGNFHTEEFEVQRHAVFAISRVGVAKNKYGDALHREAPNHTEGIQIREKSDITAADDDRNDLQSRNNVDDRSEEH